MRESATVFNKKTRLRRDGLNRWRLDWIPTLDVIRICIMRHPATQGGKIFPLGSYLQLKSELDKFYLGGLLQYRTRLLRLSLYFLRHMAVKKYIEYLLISNWEDQWSVQYRVKTPNLSYSCLRTPDHLIARYPAKG